MFPVLKNLETDTVGTTDFNHPKGHSKPYDATPSNKIWGKEG